jgi:DNA-directed RNA polymerase sigma subunit (sigma70/sigma32)
MEPTPEAVVERSLLRQCLENALAIELSPHERDVIRLRHGLDDGVSRTLKEVSVSCGGTLTPNDIRRAEYRAYRKLRIPRSVHNQRLMGFVDDVSSFEESHALLE